MTFWEESQHSSGRLPRQPSDQEVGRSSEAGGEVAPSSPCIEPTAIPAAELAAVFPGGRRRTQGERWSCYAPRSLHSQACTDSLFAFLPRDGAACLAGRRSRSPGCLRTPGRHRRKFTLQWEGRRRRAPACWRGPSVSSSAKR